MFGMFFGKPRSKLGRWLDSRGISQEWLASKTDISRNTISKITSDKYYSPRLTTIQKIMKAIREVDASAKTEDFFDI
jgi:DNA-binding XRE family transcriptional regulator